MNSELLISLICIARDHADVLKQMPYLAGASVEVRRVEQIIEEANDLLHGIEPCAIAEGLVSKRSTDDILG